MKKVTLHPAERNNYKRFYDMADGVYEIRNLDISLQNFIECFLTK